jgi:hypothetical protein
MNLLGVEIPAVGVGILVLLTTCRYLETKIQGNAK